MMKGTQVKISLSGRDGYSNRFLPSWGIIPNTHLGIPREGSLRSPLVQLKYNRGYDQCRALRDTTNMPRVIGTLTLPWAYAIGSPHILTASRVRTFTAHGPSLS